MNALTTPILVFWSAFVVAIVSTGLVVFSQNPVYAVLNLIVSLFSVSLVFYSLGAPFLAVLEIIVYAGAIMVLFLFVVMMLNLGDGKMGADIKRPSGKQLLIPGFLAILLALDIVFVLFPSGSAGTSVRVFSAGDIGEALFRKHYLGVELASLVLLIGMVGGMHLGRAASPEDTSEAHLG